jgi:hypothetical protein
MSNPKTCCICQQEMSIDTTCEKGEAGEHAFWPPLMSKADGRVGHPECLLLAGIATFGDPEFTASTLTNIKQGRAFAAAKRYLQLAKKLPGIAERAVQQLEGPDTPEFRAHAQRVIENVLEDIVAHRELAMMTCLQNILETVTDIDMQLRIPQPGDNTLARLRGPVDGPLSPFAFETRDPGKFPTPASTVTCTEGEGEDALHIQIDPSHSMSSLTCGNCNTTMLIRQRLRIDHVICRCGTHFHINRPDQ